MNKLSYYHYGLPYVWFVRYDYEESEAITISWFSLHFVVSLLPYVHVSRRTDSCDYAQIEMIMPFQSKRHMQR